MTEQAQSNDNTFVGIMLLKDGKWTPHSKYDVNALGGALMTAKELDNDTEYDGVKVMKITAGEGAENKEVWVSPRFEARQKAHANAKVREGELQTSQQFANAHQERKAQSRRK
jgi:hypothetical protein